MSGRDESSKPVEAATSGNEEQAFVPPAPAPPSFGHAEPEPAVPEEPTAGSGSGAPWWTRVQPAESEGFSDPAGFTDPVAFGDPAGFAAAGSTGPSATPPAADWPGVAGWANPEGPESPAEPAEQQGTTDMPPPPWLAADPDVPDTPDTADTAGERDEPVEPPLVPDAILPPGTLPKAIAGPAQEPLATRPVPGPAASSGATVAPEESGDDVVRPDEFVPWLEALPDDDLQRRMASHGTAAADRTPPAGSHDAAAQGHLAQGPPAQTPPDRGAAGPFASPATAVITTQPGGVPPGVPPVPGEFPGNTYPGGAHPGDAPISVAPALPQEKGNRALLLAAGGGAVAIVIGVAALIGFGGDSESSTGRTAARSTGKTSVPVPPPNGDGATATTSPTRGTAVRPPIDSEKTDQRPLAMTEVFPTSDLALAGRQWRRDGASVNHNCTLAARGAMATALKLHHCRSVLRATYVNRAKEFAITTGVAVLPTKADAVAVSKAGDPERYEWFRGMRSAAATQIDQAGGFASSTVRGRYVIYSYAQYVKGERPPSAPPAVLRNLTRTFIDYAARPIDARAR